MTEAKEDPFKKRKASVQVQDPAKSLQEHGVHGKREVSSTLPPSRRLVTLPIDRIRPGRYQKRETVNAEEFQQLKDQIAELGLQFTAIVCRDPDDEHFYNLMMGGHLRLRAAAELGITEVQAVIQDYDRLRLAKGTYFENKGRQPLTVIEEGLIFQQLKEDENWSQERMAQELKVSRSYVSMCILASNSAPDIQAMLRADPGRGQRCFYYLRQLDELGLEKAMSLRAPIIENFLNETISTDQVKLLVEQILKAEKGEEEVSVEAAKGKEKTVSVLKSFRRYEKILGERPPTEAEREDLIQVKERIEQILARSSGEA
jgi:ParB/RepB/Spo0J family partition protein